MYQTPIRSDEILSVYCPPIRPHELYHHGRKGQKWGVRNGPPYPLEQSVVKSHKPDKIKTVVSGHQSTPRKSTPNSIRDHVGNNGKVDIRTFYDNDGMILKDIHTTNHGNPKKHPYGQHGEHIHDYEWYEDGSLKKRVIRELTDLERKENGDIL